MVGQALVTGVDTAFVEAFAQAPGRADADDLPLTQEFLAVMLCVQRPSITVIARTLQQAGIIRYAQGRVTVLDREGLEATACDCYRAVRERFDRLLG